MSINTREVFDLSEHIESMAPRPMESAVVEERSERSERDAAVQAIFDGRGRLEEGFKSIEKYKNPPKQEKDDTNPAV